MNDTTRQILLNQYVILERLAEDNHDAKHFRTLQKIVSEGFVAQYHRLFHNLTAEFDEKVMQEVSDTLNLCRSLKNFVSKESPNYSVPLFEGFDANEEAAHYVYAEFLLRDLGMYKEFHDVEINSHDPKLETYRIMIDRWRKQESREHLNDTDVRYIVDELIT